MSNDDMGDRLKDFEQMEAGRKLLPTLPVCIRIDGKGFSRWTKGLQRPYDERMSNLMIATTKALVEETNALVGFTQSDEISLILYSDDYKKEIFFDGKIQKLVSVIASMATGYFNLLRPQFIPEKTDVAFFDCRVWNVPNLTEATNTILWREFDATKNSISMAARHYYSHKQLDSKNGSEMQEMLFAKGVNWNDYPGFFKRGSYLRRVKKQTKFTIEEINNLPEHHEARRNPDLTIERSVVETITLPPLSKVENRVDVLFFGAEPKLKESTNE